MEGAQPRQRSLSGRDEFWLGQRSGMFPGARGGGKGISGRGTEGGNILADLEKEVLMR